MLSVLAFTALFFACALRRTRGYMVCGTEFPCAVIDETDIAEVLHAADAGMSDVETVVVATPEFAAEGFDSIVIARAQRRT